MNVFCINFFNADNTFAKLAVMFNKLTDGWFFAYDCAVAEKYGERFITYKRLCF